MNTYTTASGKKISLPLRAYKKTDLADMGIPSVEGSIYFNKFTPSKAVPKVDDQVARDMAVVNYPDVTQNTYSDDQLRRIMDKQASSNPDLFVVPTFKKETRYDTIRRLKIARAIREKTGKDVIFEVAYNAEITVDELVKHGVGYDMIWIHYGSHYIHPPGFYKIASWLVTLRRLTDHPVQTSGVPLIFRGDQPGESVFMPCWPLIADGWIKCWRKGGGTSATIRAIDPEDRKNKTQDGWLKSGYTLGTEIKQIGRTVMELFRDNKAGEEARAALKREVLNETLMELNQVMPKTIESYAINHFANHYSFSIIALYSEKMLQEQVFEGMDFNYLTFDEKTLLANKLRKNISPSVLHDRLKDVKSMLRIQGPLPISELIAEVDKTQSEA